MLKSLGPSWVESSDGYTVRRTNRTELIYTEGERTVVVEVEPGDGLAVYAQTIKEWKEPFEDEPLTAADRERILSRIMEALAHMDVNAMPHDTTVLVV
jgi:hypothetical protein